MSDASRPLILARRAKFIAAALASVAATATEACGTDPVPCLEPPLDASVQDTGVQDASVDDASTKDADENVDAEPQPCLFAPIDGG